MVDFLFDSIHSFDDLQTKNRIFAKHLDLIKNMRARFLNTHDFFLYCKSHLFMTSIAMLATRWRAHPHTNLLLECQHNCVYHSPNSTTLPHFLLYCFFCGYYHFLQLEQEEELFLPLLFLKRFKTLNFIGVLSILQPNLIGFSGIVAHSRFL